MDWFWKQLQAEWGVIRKIPLHFAFICLVCLGASYFLVGWIYQERIGAMKDLLDVYHQKLDLAPYDKTALAALTNAQVKGKAIELAEQIREFTSQAVSADEEMSTALMREMQAARTEEEKQKVWAKQNQELANAGIARNSQYDTRFKTDAILLRDEILTRLPSDVTSKYKTGLAMSMYDYPTNPIGMKMVADHLEEIAKLLPES